jgi:hypothetical protein
MACTFGCADDGRTLAEHLTEVHGLEPAAQPINMHPVLPEHLRTEHEPGYYVPGRIPPR